MRVTLTLQHDDVREVEPSMSDSALVTGSCPKCRATPFRVQGSGRSIESHDTYRAAGYCATCRAAVGVIRAVMDTLFGLEEDEAVLVRGRARVY